MPLAEIIAGGAAVTQAIAQVVPLLNQARSVVLEVDNNTDRTLLRKVSDEHAHGGFAVIPSSEIPTKHADVFGSQSKGGSVFTGTEGSITYTGDGFTLTISWDNPFLGDNSCDARIAGDNAAKFRVVHTCGVGNIAAHMRYELFDRILANFANQKHSGNPVLIQSRFGSQGNFELLSPLATGGLAAYFRDNDAPGHPWGGPTIFGTELGKVDAVTMIQSNFGSPGNLEVIARVGDRLRFFFRDSGPEFKWSGPFPLIADGVEVSGVSGNPVLLQSRFGHQGNFELLVPLAKGGLAFFFRDNDTSGLPWHGPLIFGSNQYDGVTMIQSNLGDPGNLEVIASSGGSFDFFFRDSGWNGPFPLIVDGNKPFVVANPVLIQSTFGTKGNFELIAPEASFNPGGGIVHFFRNNDDSSLPWHQSDIFGRGSSQTDQIGAVTMIQSNFGSPGNLEVIARIGERLAFFFRDSGSGSIWNGPFFL